MRIYIYTLSDPTKDEVRYIGISKNPRKRLWQHLYKKELIGNNRKINWIKSLLKRNTKPKLDILDFIDVNIYREAFWLEQYWISQFLTWGFNLVNGTNGGEGVWGMKMSESHKIAIIQANKGKIVSEESKIRMSNSMKELIKLNGRTSNQIINDSIALIISNRLKNGDEPKIIANELGLKLHIIKSIRDGRTFKHISGGKIKTFHKPKINDAQELEIVRLIDSNHSNKEICKLFSISEPTLSKIRKKHGKSSK